MRGKLGLGVLLAAVLGVAAPVFAQAPGPAEGKPGGKRVRRVDRFAHYPSVKKLILNQVTYNCCRHQETWLDK